MSKEVRRVRPTVFAEEGAGGAHAFHGRSDGRIPAISTVSGIHNAPVTTVRYVSAVHYCIALYSDELVLNQCRTMEWPGWMATGRYMGVSRFCVFIYKNVLLLFPKGPADLRPARSVMWHLPGSRSIKTTRLTTTAPDRHPELSRNNYNTEGKKTLLKYVWFWYWTL